MADHFNIIASLRGFLRLARHLSCLYVCQIGRSFETVVLGAMLGLNINLSWCHASNILFD